MAAKLNAITRFLDRELRIGDFKDSSHNGLQVQNSGKVTRVCCGVDASLAFFEEAARRGADLAICHHGLSWGDSLKRITDLNYGRISFLIRHDIALYACHLPLDAHPRLGNNAQLCRLLGLRKVRPFGIYEGKMIGFAGELPRAMPYGRFKALVGSEIAGGDLRAMDFGRKVVRTVGVISGGAAHEAKEAGQAGLDVYLTGEANLSAWHVAQEYGINVVFAGHYATERFGVMAIGRELSRRFGLKADFIDLQVPF
jgi:dinuclear metal center YbgI/SA1388 family protein